MVAKTIANKASSPLFLLVIKNRILGNIHFTKTAMRIKTIVIIVITILLTIIITQNSDTPVNLKLLFFTKRTSALIMMLLAVIAGFIVGYLAGRPKMKKLGNDYGHGYDEGDDRTHEGLNKNTRDTLSDEDREYIS